MKKRFQFTLCCLIMGICVIVCASWLSSAVTTISENEPIIRKNRIIIDAGHGGEDGGATSCTGILESTYNLQIAIRLNDLFHLLGFDTVMIRTSDISIYTKGDSIAQKKMSDLKERVRIVNETENAILLSIHQNNFSDSRYSGAQVFYADSPESREFARQIQAAILSVLNPGSRRQIKRSDRIYIMEHIKRPGILIECGFLSNPAEESRLRSADYQQKLCCVIASATSQYLKDAAIANT